MNWLNHLKQKNCQILFLTIDRHFVDQYKKIAHGIHGQSKRLLQRVYTYYYLTIDDFLFFVLEIISKSGEYSGIKPFNESIILDVL